MSKEHNSKNVHLTELGIWLVSSCILFIILIFQLIFLILNFNLINLPLSLISFSFCVLAILFSTKGLHGLIKTKTESPHFSIFVVRTSITLIFCSMSINIYLNLLLQRDLSSFYDILIMILISATIIFGLVIKIVVFYIYSKKKDNTH